jgi:hypothetical protein
MLKDMSRGRLAGGWCVAVVAIGALSVISGAALSISNAELLLIACVVPPSVMLLMWRGAPPRTVAEVLYAADTPANEGRSR